MRKFMVTWLDFSSRDVFLWAYFCASRLGLADDSSPSELYRSIDSSSNHSQIWNID